MDPDQPDNQEVSESKKTLILCPQCKKGFPTPSKVKRHLLAVHEKIREFQCDICSHAFSQKIHVLKHRQAVHKKELEANPDLLGKRDFKIPDCTVEPQKHVEVFNTPFQTMTVDKVTNGNNKSGGKKSKLQQNKNNHISSSPSLVQITTASSDASGLIVADPKQTLATTSIIPSPPIGLSFISSHCFSSGHEGEVVLICLVLSSWPPS